MFKSKTIVIRAFLLLLLPIIIWACKNPGSDSGDPSGPSVFSLNVSASPSGGGSVTKTPDALSYDDGTLVTLEATANSGYIFDLWNDAADGVLGTDNPYAITVTSDKTISGEFAVNASGAASDLAVVGLLGVGTGGSTGVNTPAKTIDGDASSRGAGLYNGTDEVVFQYELESAAEIGYAAIKFYNSDSRTYYFRMEVSANGTDWTEVFDGTSTNGTPTSNYENFNCSPLTTGKYIRIMGAGTGAADSWTSINEIRFFDSSTPIQYTLTTSSSPAYGGSITLDPNQASYDEGTIVTVTAVPATDYEFVQWQGDLSGTDNPATITLDANKSITAVFNYTGTGGAQLIANWTMQALTIPADRYVVVDSEPNGGSSDLPASSSSNQGVFSINASGIVGNCVSLDQSQAAAGEYNYFKLTGDTALNFRDGLTLEIWVNLSVLADTVNNVCLIDRAGTNTGYRLYIRGGATATTDNNSVRFKVGTGSASVEANSSTVKIDTTGVWYHIVAVFDGTNIIIYINGVQADSRALGATQIGDNPTDDVKVGGESESSPKNVNGLIDEVRIYNYALSSSEISTRYNTLKP